MSALDRVDGWPVPTAAAAVVVDGAVVEAVGPQEQRFRWASVTKVLTALATWVAIEEGTVDLDEPAGPHHSTVRHLLAHASGLAFDTDAVIAVPGAKRIYSNTGIEVLARHVGERAGMAFGDYLREGVLEPLGLASTRCDGSPAADAVGSVADLARLAAELQVPTLVSPDTLGRATSVAFPGLVGILPGFGRQDPNDWGLGVEVRGHKAPHWTPATASPRTFGHFGQSGGFVWVDPDAGVALACLTDRDFGPWAAEHWPLVGADVLAAHGRP